MVSNNDLDRYDFDAEELADQVDALDVEVIERWDAGGTMYSVDGGETWWTKEQYAKLSALLVEARLDELLSADDALRLHGRDEYQTHLQTRIKELEKQREADNG